MHQKEEKHLEIKMIHRRKSNPQTYLPIDEDTLRSPDGSREKKSSSMCLKICIAMVLLVAVLSYFNQQAVSQGYHKATGKDPLPLAL
jgi:hypothetical protein